MQPTSTHDEADQATPPRFRGRTTLIVLVTLFLVFLLIAFLPPLVNLSRFRQRIAGNISAVLGRPVHFDRVSLTLLPLPGFTLENFVIDEDPAFGYEPILRAGQVDVTVRLTSLLHPHAEVSKIALSAGSLEMAPSVNLVHASTGKWNIESLLLQASHIQAAPTAQRFAGPARRFPYIEATGARLNLKLDQDKTPVSLTDADFALWLPEPHQWHVRLKAHPVRTDTAPGDTGIVRAEGTLGGADLNAQSLAQVPIDLHGDWRDAQLGGISHLVLGRDPGLRGDFAVSFAITGTIGHNAIATHIKLAKARRADFVPDHTLALEASCDAIAGDTFHSFTSIECRWPPAGSSDPAMLIVAGNLPDVRQPQSASATLTLPSLPVDTFFDWLSIATPHPPTVLAGAGTLAGTLNWRPPPIPTSAARTRGAAPPPPKESPSGKPTLTGELELAGSSIAIDRANNRSISLRDVVLRSTAAPPPTRPHAARSATPQVTPAPDSFDLLPISLALGGKQPAILDGHVDATGYTLHLTGTVLPARLLELAKAVPQLGDGLEPLLDQVADATPDSDHSPETESAEPDESAQPEPAALEPQAEARSAPAPESQPEPRRASSVRPPKSTGNEPAPDATIGGPTLSAVPIHIDFTATRTWGGPQIWRETTPPPTHPHRRTFPANN
jgi:hypothetical protein